MTITIPNAVITALLNTGIFLALCAVVFVVIAAIGGYFYSKEMSKIDNPAPKAKRTRRPKLTT